MGGTLFQGTPNDEPESRHVTQPRQSKNDTDGASMSHSMATWQWQRSGIDIAKQGKSSCSII
jgi:hypothetical protein